MKLVCVKLLKRNIFTIYRRLSNLHPSNAFSNDCMTLQPTHAHMHLHNAVLVKNRSTRPQSNRYTQGPHAGSAVVRIDPLCFLAGCHTRRLNQAISVLYLSMFYCVVYWGPFYVLLVFVGMCSVFWLF